MTTTQVSLLFDGGNKVTYAVKPTLDVQTFDITPPRHAKTVTLEIDKWIADPSKGGNVGLDNIWLYAQRPASYAAKVKPMLNIGAMVEYPRGPGGIVLCNVLFKDTEGYPENVGKKQTILATLLKNLQAPFTGGKSIIAGEADLAYTPLDIGKQANQYRNDQGWFGDRQFTFADLPGGTQHYAGRPLQRLQLHDVPGADRNHAGRQRHPGRPAGPRQRHPSGPQGRRSVLPTRGPH